MAYFPCDLCGIRYRGPSQHLYPALVHAGETKRNHLRLHPDCFFATIVKLEPYRVDENDSYVNRRADEQPCEACGKPIEDSAKQVFVTAYPKSEDRSDFWLGFHQGCRPPLWIETLFK